MGHTELPWTQRAKYLDQPQIDHNIFLVKTWPEAAQSILNSHILLVPYNFSAQPPSFFNFAKIIFFAPFTAIH